MMDRQSLSEHELKAIAYFAVGVSTEGSLAGKDVSNRLSFAGRWLPDGRMAPIERSGESIGTLQNDLGQDGGITAAAMMDAYRRWAAEGSDRVVFNETDHAKLVHDFSRDGKAIRDDGGRAIDPAKRAEINRFLASDAGRDFVHQRDLIQVSNLNRKGMNKLVSTPAYRSASTDDQIVMATAIAKAINQNPRAAKKLLSAMARPVEAPDAIASHAKVMAYLDSKFEGALEVGQTHALAAAKVFTRLHNAPEGSPLHTAWHEVLRDPLMTPSLIGKDPQRPDLAAHYTLVRNLFLDPGKAIRFIDALEQGRAHSDGKLAQAGFHTDGTQIVQWNADGKGVTFVEGQWATVSRDELGLTRARDGSVDLARVVDGEGQPLLHVEPAVRSVAAAAVERALRPGVRGDDVRQLQEQLMRLGYSDAQGRPLRADGDYGPGTQAAVRAFQREHDLVADGLSGRQTLASVRQAVHDRDASIAAAHRPHDEVMAAYRAIDPVMGAAAGRSTPVEARVDARATSEAMSTYQSLEPVTRTAAPPIAPIESPVAREPVAIPADREAPAADASLAPTRAPFDPRHADHPQNDLYQLLKTQLPDASENRLLQTTAACHRSRITAENLSMVHINEETMTLHVFGHGPMTLPARVDLNHPSPAPEQSVERMAQFDLQQAQVLAEIQAQQAQMSRGMSR
ncbi:peptidoglycan-binding protein [Luteibacter sp. 3190]|uniref:peptidoglycan-binding protein n=1 Tax=Luteibacter sp. 3190 TaxID=2817736 RepID=UPI00285893C4|nr:peptidoglycan-binding protein [Luteibacter sp. 3190]MDR6937151.1 peptidoglycan hydrolase-like protein with peptidoglycan-binding domain [Luteibacter sp. 3190]